MKNFGEYDQTTSGLTVAEAIGMTEDRVAELLELLPNLGLDALHKKSLMIAAIEKAITDLHPREIATILAFYYDTRQ